MVLSINKTFLWHLFAGSRGGVMRMRIINEIVKQPMNANQLTKKLKIDYKTARHHLGVLLKNKMIQNNKNKGKYASTYHISGILESNMFEFSLIWAKFNKSKLASKN